MKTCSKCNETKSFNEFYNCKSKKDGKQGICKSCNRKRFKKYHQEHKDERRKRMGYQSMEENKSCSQYLGIVIAERLCRHLFKNVQVMPNNHSGFDIICNKGKLIDVKSAITTLSRGKYPQWAFTINYNKTADFFILVAFDNRKDLNPLHLWMIPGKEINNNSGKSIRPSTIHKWDKWERSIEEVQMCCADLRLD
ncbi:hypothetical protein KAU33_16215 [Candidatus Dependentiae bacterium]|nr:hypothetical protein [Candidatus Dependentiae bacterium]